MAPFNPGDCLILVVDDVPQNLRVIGEMLEQAGYETTFATSGRQALERVQGVQPDLILLDLMMPEMDGLEVCEKLKENPNFCQVPVIFLTASTSQEDLLRAFKTGAVDYITKPFRPAEVIIRIETHLTNQKLKQQLEAQNQQLQEEIRVRREAEDALKQAKDSAETANRAKSIFLANMSHELRTPLNAILGFAQLMGRASNLTPEQQSNLDTIHRSGEHLLNLINDILDFSKIEAGRITVNEIEFNLMQMLLELEHLFQLKASEKGLQLELQLMPNVPHIIRNDRLKLRQILINLLGNAIKFTKIGHISLFISAIFDDGKTLLSFEVSDTGIGIAPHELNHLFEPFVQTKSGMSMPEGTGLGLVISYRYVQLLGGTISVSSQVGQGTTFCFQIPVIIVEQANLPPPTPICPVITLAPNQPQYRILVVDDHRSNRQLLAQMLSAVGFEVKMASNGCEALELWKVFQPHLIWMDMRMPVMDGYTATQKIKETAQDQAPTIIAVTASAFEEQKALILSAGCDDIVYKPIQESIIFDKIAHHLGVKYLYYDTQIYEAQDSNLNRDLSALKQLPLALLAQLEDAILALDEKLLRQLISQISPEHTVLAQAIENYMYNFQYQEILQAIEVVKEG